MPAARSRPLRRRFRWAHGRRSGPSSPIRCSGPIASRGTDLANVNPFQLAAEELGAKAKGPGDLTVVVVGARVDGDDQFLILASYANAPHAWWPVGADNLLDSCS